MTDVYSPYMNQLYKTNNEIIADLNINKKLENVKKNGKNVYNPLQSRYDSFNGENSNENGNNDDGYEEEDGKAIGDSLNRLIAILGKQRKGDKNHIHNDSPKENIEVFEEIPDDDENDDYDYDDYDDLLPDENENPIDDDSNGDDDVIVEVNTGVVGNDNTDHVCPHEHVHPPEEPVAIISEKPHVHEEISDWARDHPEQFHTFVHDSVVMKDENNEKFKKEMTCLIYCDRLKAHGGGHSANTRQCVCPPIVKRVHRKRRRQTDSYYTNMNLDSLIGDEIGNSRVLSQLPLSTDMQRNKKEISPASTFLENKLKSSENLLDLFKNNNKEDKNQVDGEKLKGSLIDSASFLATRLGRENIPYKEEKPPPPSARSDSTIMDLMQVSERFPKCDACSKFLSSQCNATELLNRVLQELELMKEERECASNRTEGSACNMTGSWNSEIVGMRFDISSGCSNEHELTVKVTDHNPPKRQCLMDKHWTLVGWTLHQQGGPFYMAATRNKEEILATFTGMCRVCSGTDTIFGTWNFVRPAKDCRDVIMAFDTKKDIFHKTTMHLKKIEKQRELEEKKKREEDAAAEEAERLGP